MTQTSSSDFAASLERVCDGSDEAVWEFIEEYGPHIQRVVRRKLNQNLRSKFDSVDFVQMVWASFFTDPQRIAGFKQPQELIRYLVAMARNKVVDESRRRFKLAKHNVSRECSLQHPDVSESTQRVHDTPSQVAIARECREDMMDQQSTERDREILKMRMDGATFNEIGATLGINERTARKVIRRLAAAK